MDVIHEASEGTGAVLDQYCCCYSFLSYSLHICVDFDRLTCWILFLSGLKERLAVTFEEVKKVHEMISEGLSAGTLQVQV